MAWVSNLDAGAGLFFASVRIAAVLAPVGWTLFHSQAPAATVAGVQDRWMPINTKTSVLRCLTLTYSFQAEEACLVWNYEHR